MRKEQQPQIESRLPRTGVIFEAPKRDDWKRKKLTDEQRLTLVRRELASLQ